MPAPTEGFHALLLVAVLAGGGCVAARPPVAFPNSALFSSLSSALVTWRSYDVDPDIDLERALALRRVPFGFVVDMLAREKGEGDTWRRTCMGPVVRGEGEFRLEPLQKVGAVVLIAEERDPDQIVQTVSVIRADTCAETFHERLVLNRPASFVLAPGSVPGGFRVSGSALEAIDDPAYLHLKALDGELLVLTSIAVRTIDLRQTPPRSTPKRRISLLQRRTTWVVWRAAGEQAEISRKNTPAPVRPELSDDDPVTSFALPGFAEGRFEVASDAPLALVEVLQGCLGAPSTGVGSEVLHVAIDGAAGVLGLGAARGAEGARRTLVAFASPQGMVVWPVVANDHAEVRCLREVKGYGWRRVYR